MRRLKNRRGATLVELLVTFALFAIFLTAAVGVISPCMRIFLQIKYMSYAQNVSAMVMSKIEDEIAMATGNVLVDTTGARISFEDSYETALYMEAGTNNLLNIHYRGVLDETGAVAKATDWQYDAKAYQGFAIKGLTFAQASGGRGVKITLELQNAARDLTYSTEKVIECYNLEKDAQVTVGQVITDDKAYLEGKTA